MSSAKILAPPRLFAVLSRAVISSLLVAAFALAPAAANAQTAIPFVYQSFNVVPITITSVLPQNGQLVANGVMGSNTFSTPISLLASPNPDAAATCPILNLQLGPINLNVLGLNVATSQICLDITAHQGGGLLGDLLCGIANLLNGGTPVAAILDGLTTDQLSVLNAGLTSALNQAVFIPLSSSPALAAASCNVLNLALGPIDLNLLGLQVELNDCAGGPVKLDVTANPAGGLLGNLLCSLTNALTNNPIRGVFLFRQISSIIGFLLS